MNLPSLKKQILDKKCERMYVFHGTETYVIDEYIKKISEVLGLKVVYPNTLASVYKKLNVGGLFDEGKLYVVTNDKEAYRYEETYKDLPEIMRKSKNALILKYDLLTPQAKIAQVLEDRVVQFSAMGESVLVNHIQRLIGETEYAELLARACDYDFGRIVLELEKIKVYAEVNGKEPNEVVKEVFDMGLVVPTSETDVYEYLDAMVANDFGKALDAVDSVRRGVTTPEGFVARLYTAVRDMMLVRAARTMHSKDIEATTGLGKSQVYMAGKRIPGFTTGALVDIVERLQKVESLMKSGKADPAVLDYVALLLLGAKK